MSNGIGARLVKCFWCGEDIGIAIPKKITKYSKEQENAYKPIVANYEPCDKCKEQWNKGDVLIEAEREPIEEGQPPIGADKAYPTGSFWVIEKGIMSNHIVLVTSEEAKALGLYDSKTSN